MKETKSFPNGAVGKESACKGRRCKRRGFDPWVGKIPWRRQWHPTPVFLPGESHGQRRAAAQRVAELNMTKRLCVKETKET